MINVSRKISLFLTIFVLHYLDSKLIPMTTKTPPSFVRVIKAVVLDENHFTVNLNIYRPDIEGGNTETRWSIYGFCNHNTGRIWDAKEAPILEKRLRAKIKSMRDFDAEYTYYKTLADEFQK